jgi:urease accessory protein UreF
MQEMTLEPYTLMHLADSALPTGGFAFSQGLESMGKSGHLKSESDFREYLTAQLKTVGEFELPFMNSAYALCDDFDQAVPKNGKHSTLSNVSAKQVKSSERTGSPYSKVPINRKV